MKAVVVDTKVLVTQLRECQNCGLLYRIPTDTESQSNKFYQDKYSEGSTTDCPGEEELEQLKTGNFSATSNSYARYLSVLKQVVTKEGARIFDFGCSWGYGSFQLTQAGYDVTAYEVSVQRRQYAADKLNVKVISDLPSADGNYDAFFSAHVLEHVPDLKSVVRLAQRIVKPGGLFVAFTPNGSLGYRTSQPAAFHKSWGLAHPNVLQDKFYRHVFIDRPYLLATDPYDPTQIAAWNQNDQVICDLTGWELLALAVL
jgi:2-polyprenyl-3-methyl-5-hydroxy-6-metoxy-1,4-benzoquinol methylase